MFNARLRAVIIHQGINTVQCPNQKGYKINLDVFSSAEKLNSIFNLKKKITDLEIFSKR
jgi:hypothetical protein